MWRGTLHPSHQRVWADDVAQLLEARIDGNHVHLRFYNTLTSNCTTIVFELARLIAPTLPIDYRLLLSGHFAEYVYDLHGLTPGYRYGELQALGYINEHALASDASGDDFSMSIRQSIPGIPVNEVHP